VDFEFCDSQIEAFKRRFGHEDYPSYLGMSHRLLFLEAHKKFIDGKKLFRRENLPADTEFDELGIGRSSGSEFAFHMKRMHHPLKGAQSKNEISDYPFPEARLEDNQKLIKDIKSLHNKGIAVNARCEMTIWEASWYIRSMDELLVDMMTEDEKAEILLDKITDYACQRVEVFTKAGVDILSIGDDIGMQTGPLISIDLWKTWLKPRLIRVINTARRINPDILINYHSCGNITEFLFDLAETGIDIINPVQQECMKFDQAYDMVGDKVAFWGTIGTQQLLPFGSPEEIRKECLSRLEKCGDKGGIVLGPTHLVEPEVPWENILALVQAAREWSGAENTNKFNYLK
ncbi:uroporphyrinogen decarboxylase family protein, partial [Bacteroidota bacterium]